ncbi:hypothetical protein JAK23_04120 [Stenotrophomonas maltophilia]|uniref:hypothetical protein n=1 Tax=Stenotrophomonas maltophilia TaxID=40324 RepID=UPI0021C8967C|nr:hypothetical protein [Stenotrophomonas maltophilia]MCU1194871.1 hypothetical protein [Stenotrophomonas maltophilia]
MNNLIALEKELLAEVGSLLNKRGFGSRPVGQSFRLARSFGWASIHLSFVRHAQVDFDVVVSAAIRIDAVQDMIQDKSDRLITDKDRKNSATIGCELGNLTEEGQRRWIVSSHDDVGRVASEIVAACDEWLIPFIERHSNIAAILEVLKTDDMHAELISPIEEKRRKTILALSEILNAV